MPQLEKQKIEMIRAAGGLLWRQTPEGRQILIIHRQPYDDWTLPKGKLDKGEDWEDAALREVEEETGCSASIDGLAGITSYLVDGQPKVVLFFHMSYSGQCEEIQLGAGSEVDSLKWVSVPDALQILSYEAEKNLVRKG
jgi:8-oxo-dGTP pyrophosphatase MutT (NUDIX family)